MSAAQLLQKQDINDIAKLLERSCQNFYQVETAINWDLPVVCPSSISKEMYIDSVSQLLHAERFAVKLCTKTSHRVSDFDSQSYLLVQAMEEQRHARMYEKYIQLIGDVKEVNPAMDAIYRSVYEWDGNPLATILALNFFIEGEAINQQGKRIRTLPCPLFREINRIIIKDEGRHHAFGTLYAKKFLPTVSKIELSEILSWIKNLWTKWDDNNKNRYLEDSEGVVRNDSHELNQRFSGHLKDLEKIGIYLGN